MKTITEFDGFVLRNAFQVRRELLPERPKPEKGPKNRKKGSEPHKKEESQAMTSAETPVESPVVEETPVEMPSTEAVTETVETASVEAVAETTETAPGSEETSSEETKVEAVSESAAPEAPKAVSSDGKIDWEKFNVELSQKLQEKFQWEGEKLAMIVDALSVIHPRNVENLKRVVVFTLDENEKAPANATLRNERYYRAEYLASLNPPQKKGKKRFGKGGKGKGRFGKDKKRRFNKGKPRGDNRRPEGKPNPKAAPAR